jgi:hypothetical protein
MEVAVQDDPLLLYQSPFTFDNSLPRLLQLKVSWIRVNVIWASTLPRSQSHAREHPKTLDYNWGAYDNLVDNATAHGIQVEMTLSGPVPAWADGRKRIGVYKPSARHFGGFASDAAQHFAGRVSRYSIWNEPNYPSWLQPTSSAPEIYRALYRAGYAAVKKVSKDNEVLFGETSPYAANKKTIAPLAFVRRATCVDSRYKRHGCSALRADGYAHHPYDFKHKPTYRYPGADNVTLATLGRLTTALAKLARAKALVDPGGGALPVYLTEYGYFSSGKYRVSERKQAAYLKQAFTTAQRNSRVKQMLQYLLVTPPKSLRFFDPSIVRRNGKPLLAFKTLKAWAAKAAKAGAITTPKAP